MFIKILHGCNTVFWDFWGIMGGKVSKLDRKKGIPFGECLTKLKK